MSDLHSHQDKEDDFAFLFSSQTNSTKPEDSLIDLNLIEAKKDTDINNNVEYSEQQSCEVNQIEQKVVSLNDENLEMDFTSAKAVRKLNDSLNEESESK